MDYFDFRASEVPPPTMDDELLIYLSRPVLPPAYFTSKRNIISSFSPNNNVVGDGDGLLVAQIQMLNWMKLKC